MKMANLDIIEVAWTFPSSNGGTPVTDFSLYVRWSGTSTYTAVWEKKEQPSTVKYRFQTKDTNSNLLDHLGAVLAPGTLELAVTAHNWVGESTKSAILQIVLTTRTGAQKAVLSGTGFLNA
jgi:hypothetical protein